MKKSLGPCLYYNFNIFKSCVIENEIWQDSLSVQNDENLETAVKLSISFFEEVEEYEKCAFLKKIELFLKDNLES